MASNRAEGDALTALGWSWVSVFSLLGLAIAFSALPVPVLTALTQPGRGTSLQLIAAVIFLAAILPSLLKETSKLVICATAMATLFGIIGTWFVLAGENSLLAWAVFGAALFALNLTGLYLLATGLVGLIFRRRRT